MLFMLVISLAAFGQSNEELKKELEEVQNQLFELKADFEIEKSMKGMEEKKFKVYGYIGSRINHFTTEDENSAIKANFGKDTYFAHTNLNLYFLFKPINKFKVLTEIRFVYAPENIAETQDPVYLMLPDGVTPYGVTMTDVYTDVNFLDPGNAFSYKYHTIRIERAWAEYNYSQNINLRFGKWVTPFGIWNVDHGLPVILSPRIPYSMVLLTESQVGIQFYGKYYFPNGDLNYAAYISNGDGQMFETFDQNSNKALGGHLNYQLQSSLFKKLRIGASYYKGLRTVNEYYNKILFSDMSFTAGENIFEEYMETILGVDFEMKLKGFNIQTEYFLKNYDYNVFAYTPAALQGSMGMIGKNVETKAYYVQGSYTLPKAGIFTITPYTRYEVIDGSLPIGIPNAFDNKSMSILSPGINIRQNAFVSYKIDYTIVKFKDMSEYDINVFTLSAVVAF